MRYSRLLSIIILAVVIAFGVYLRLLPALNYSLELDANDPWIAYWIAEYFRDNGLLSFNGLKDVGLFWWPNGRDILTSEYIGTSWLAAATYPMAKLFGLTLRQWLSLFPVMAGALGILTLYVLISRMTGSRLGGLASATLFAFAPGAIVRTSAGFVEKIGIAIPIIALSYILVISAAREKSVERRILKSVAAGVSGGLVAWIWGGFDLVVITFSLTMILEPLIGYPDLVRFKTLYIPLMTGLSLVTLSSPQVGVSYFLLNIGAVVPLAIALYSLALLLNSRTHVFNRLVYLWILGVVILTGAVIVSGGALRLSGRLMAALGIRNLSPLVESVQEHAPATWGDIIQGYGIALILGFIGLGYWLYRVIATLRAGGRPSFAQVFGLSIYSLFVFLVYANKNMVYFSQMASFYAILATGLLAGSIMGARGETKAQTKRAKASRRGEAVYDQLRLTFAFTVSLIVLLGAVVYAQSSYERNYAHAPAILTSMLGTVYANISGEMKAVAPLNKAWINALDYIKDETPSDALIVSWWDYGYWITVNTGRRTVADGATLNESQIMILARILTGTEDEASGLLPLLKAEPGNTYLVFYDVFTGIVDENGTLLVFPQASTHRSPANKVVFVLHGAGDLAKSFQMLKIGRRIDPHAQTPFNLSWYATVVQQQGMTYYHFPGFVGEPRDTSEKVRNALLYKLTIYGLYHLMDRPIFDEGCDIIENATSVAPAVLATSTSPALLPPVEVERFTLEAVSVGCPVDLVRDAGQYKTLTMVAVFIYKWNG